MGKEKITRGNAGQFFVAGELCRRGYSAVVTLGNTPNTDILCSNIEGTKFVHIQVKTFVPGNRTCSVGLKAEKHFGDNFYWVLAGIPEPGNKSGFEYFIIPSGEMSKNILQGHSAWLEALGKKGQKHNDSRIRTVYLPSDRVVSSWDISEYRDRWDFLAEKLKA